MYGFCVLSYAVHFSVCFVAYFAVLTFFVPQAFAVTFFVLLFSSVSIRIMSFSADMC